MKVKQFVETLKNIAENYDTLYVMGCFGAELKAGNVERYIKSYRYNQQDGVVENIRASVDAGIFGFDCVCLVKSVLWGWNGDKSSVYGGAVYKANGVPDIGANRMIEQCTDISEDFGNVEIGAFLWLEGHCGVYIGDGLAVECTPIWKDGVQITAVKNIGEKAGYNSRRWTKHGRLPYVDYTPEEIPEETDPEEIKPEETETPDATTETPETETETPETITPEEETTPEAPEITTKTNIFAELLFDIFNAIIKAFREIFKRGG